MFVFVTKLGTAIPETALCTRCHTEFNIQSSYIIARSISEYNNKGMQDCTGTNVLSCQVCGRAE